MVRVDPFSTAPLRALIGRRATATRQQGRVQTYRAA